MAASAAAAAYVAVRPPLDLWPSLAELSADYRTAVGEQRQVALAAGATIVMNTRTSLALRPDVDDVARIELIAGEGVLSTGAYPLEVVAGDGSARGVGATFDIRRDGGEVSVTCLDGEVSVVCGASSSTLAGGHRVSYSNGRLGPVSAVEPALAASWREGFLVFRDTRLDEVVAEINRYRRGRIVLVGEALGRKTVNGRFYLSRLDDAVEKLRNAFGAHVTSLPGGVMILS
jgi:transmembrane sensor